MSTTATDLGLRLRFAAALIVWLAMLFSTLFMSGCSSACGNRLVQRVPASDGSKILYVFERDCGATTDFVTHVAVLERSDAFSDGTVGNIFVGNSNHGKVRFTLDAKWTSPTAVVIRYPAGAKVYTRVKETDGVRVSYEEF